MPTPDEVYEQVLAEEQAKGSSPAVAQARAKAARVRASRGSKNPNKPDASTAPAPDRGDKADQPAAEAKPAAAAPKGKKGAHSGFKVGPEFRAQEGETNEQKIARLKRLVEEAKRAAGKL